MQPRRLRDKLHLTGGRVFKALQDHLPDKAGGIESNCSGGLQQRCRLTSVKGIPASDGINQFRGGGLLHLSGNTLEGHQCLHRIRCHRRHLRRATGSSHDTHEVLGVVAILQHRLQRCLDLSLRLGEVDGIAGVQHKLQRGR